jgi:predicted GH43/DUF377 family glycosyl hydrolase
VYEDGGVHSFPDQATLTSTLKMLSMKELDIPRIPVSVIPGHFKVVGVLPSVIESKHPENALIASIIQRNSFFLNSKFLFLPNVWNPSIIKWSNMTIISWRLKGELKFASVNENLFSARVSAEDILIGPELDGIPFDGNKHEDPRLFTLTNGKLLVTFTSVTPPRGKKRIPHAMQSYSLGTYNAPSGVTFEKALLFDQDFGGWQKNWVPFEYDASLYFIQQIFPPRIFRVIGKFPTNQTVQFQEIPILDPPRSLPWFEEFGVIRGGTPAIYVRSRNLFLMVFHSVYRFRDYYMGAMTLCPRPPFSIHSISPVPIVDLQFYSGPRMSRKVPYVVFPTSLALSEGETDVILAFGHQDKNGVLARFPLSDLLGSLTTVQPCPAG